MLKKSYTEHVIKDQLARVIYNRLGTIGNSIGTNKLCTAASGPVLALLQGYFYQKLLTHLNKRTENI